MKRFDDAVVQSKPTVVDFFATWCGPCGRQMSVVDDFAAKMGEKVNVVKVDVDKERELAATYHVQSIPTIIIFKNGEVMWRASGVQSLSDLMTALSKIEWR